METEAQGGDQEGAPHAAQVTVPAPMFQGLPVPDGGVRGERPCSQGQTRAMAAGLRQPHPCAGPWLGLSPRSGRPARPAGQHGLGVVAAWPGLVASQQEPRGLSGDPALFHGPGSRSILGSGPGAFQDEGILLLQRRLERQAGPRGPGSLGKPRSAFPCWIPPALLRLVLVYVRSGKMSSGQQGDPAEAAALVQGAERSWQEELAPWGGAWAPRSGPQCSLRLLVRGGSKEGQEGVGEVAV